MADLGQLGIFGVPLFGLIGFMFAAYAIVANDVIQTLGTFLASNSKRHWLVLWAFAASIIVASCSTDISAITAISPLVA